MKTILRIAAILVVIGIVSGGIYAIVQSGAVGADAAGFEGHGRLDGRGRESQRQSGTWDGVIGTADRPARGKEGEHGGPGGGVAFGRGLVGVLRNVVLVAVVTTVVVGMQKLLSHVSRRRTAGPA